MQIRLGRNSILYALAASPLVPFIRQHEEAEEGAVILVVTFTLVWVLLAFGAGVASAAVVSDLIAGPVHVSPGKSLDSYVYANAPRYHVDPAAELAITTMEGGGGGIGDNGTSFGPNQLHYGGALPASVYHGPYSEATQAWAWSSTGINFVLREEGELCGGLTGYVAVKCIAYRFERSANTPRETAGAWAHYHLFKAPVKHLSRGQKLRNRHASFHSWLDWSLAVGPWKGYRRFNMNVRPHVKRPAPVKWWKARARYVRRHKR